MASNKLISEGSIPHTSGSLAAVLGISQQNVKKNLDKLVEANLIALVPTYKRRDRKCYALNPYLVRRGKGVSSLLPELFNDPLPKVLDKDWSKEPNLK
jgi:predicted AAA+ superfamily ATPase